MHYECHGSVVQSLSSQAKKLSHILGILPIRGEKAFPEFIKALVETRQEHAAGLLDSALTQQFIVERDNDDVMEVDAVSAPSAAVHEKEKSVNEKVSEIRAFST